VPVEEVGRELEKDGIDTKSQKRRKI